ncbi:MAG: hypothetical protein ACQEW9_01675 [Bacteroidota bacterium]
MKKTFTSSFLGLVISGLLLGACSQIASYENEDLQLEQAKVDKDGGFVLTPLGGGESFREYDEADCSIDCIEPGSEDYFVKSGTATESSGGGNNINTKEVTYRAYNTETDFVVEVDYNKLSGNFNAQADITIAIDGDLLLIEEVPFGSTVSHSIPLPDGWMACDVVEYYIIQEGGGNGIAWIETYSLFEVCSDCEESFTYEASEEDGTITFFYTPEESMDDAELVFTFAQSVEVLIDEFSPAGATMQATMDLEACVTYTFEATVESLRCIGQGLSEVNVWTDFKVVPADYEGDDEDLFSKKNDDTPNIVWACPGEE